MDSVTPLRAAAGHDRYLSLRWFALVLTAAILAAGGLTGASATAASPDSAPADSLSAQSAPTLTTQASRCLYMTTGVQRIDGITIGEFYVLRLRNDRFRGYTGAFYSEFATVRGKLVGRQARLRIGDPYDQTVWTRVIERWQPKKHKFKGWRSRSENRLRTLSGGNIPFSNAICG